MRMLRRALALPAHSCRDLLGVNEPRAQILLDAQEVLLRFAIRYQWSISSARASSARKARVIPRLRWRLFFGVWNGSI